MKLIHRALFATGLLSCFSAQAGTETTETSTVEETSSSSSATGLLVGKLTGDTTLDRMWSAFTLYKDDNNPILQEFSLQGRSHIQYADGDSSTKDYFNSGKTEAIWKDHFEARRNRFGFKSKWFQNWKFEGQIDIDPDGHDDLGDNTFYKNIHDLYITYAQSDALNVSVGKAKVKFSREHEISSKEILTIERSYVSNLLFPGELTGAWVNGKGIADHWLYEFGVYSNERAREFSDFDGGAIILGKIGYDYSTQAGLDSAVASIHYMHNTEPDLPKIVEPEWSGSSTPAFSDSIALTNEITHGRFGLTTDLLYGFGDDALGKSDVLGVSFIPSYFIADGLQLVGRVQVASANDPDGLSLPGRYEGASGSPDPDGNTYVSGYVGLNYYIHGHKLKLMNGIEYSHLGGGDYDGYTFLSGLRFYF